MVGVGELARAERTTGRRSGARERLRQLAVVPRQELDDAPAGLLEGQREVGVGVEERQHPTRFAARPINDVTVSPAADRPCPAVHSVTAPPSRPRNRRTGSGSGSAKGWLVWIVTGRA